MIPFILSQEQHGERKATSLDRNSSGKWQVPRGWLPELPENPKSQKKCKYISLTHNFRFKSFKEIKNDKKSNEQWRQRNFKQKITKDSNVMQC